MIYHEIALEPTAIEDLKDLGLLERMFGFEHGRLIASFPAKPREAGSWGKLFLRHLFATFPPEKHKELEIRVEQMLPKLIWGSRNSSRLEDGQEWWDLATKEHELHNFSCMIGKGERDHSSWVPFQKLYAPDCSMPAFLSGPVHYGDTMQDPVTFLTELAPLLLSAIRISFIDPYFNPVHYKPNTAKRWDQTASEIAKYFRRSGRMTARICFHTGVDEEISAAFPDPQNFVQNIADTISRYFPATTELSVSAWKTKPGGIPFHARYLISDKAGVALDYGIDIGRDKRTDVALLPAAFANNRLNEFKKGDTTPYIWKASINMHGKG